MSDINETIEAAVRALYEELPVDQVRHDSDGWAWQKSSNGGWYCARPNFDAILTDDDVRDWPILVPEADLDEAHEARLKAELPKREEWA